MAHAFFLGFGKILLFLGLCSIGLVHQNQDSPELPPWLITVGLSMTVSGLLCMLIGWAFPPSEPPIHEAWRMATGWTIILLAGYLLGRGYGVGLLLVVVGGAFLGKPKERAWQPPEAEEGRAEESSETIDASAVASENDAS